MCLDPERFQSIGLGLNSPSGSARSTQKVDSPFWQECASSGPEPSNHVACRFGPGQCSGLASPGLHASHIPRLGSSLAHRRRQAALDRVRSWAWRASSRRSERISLRLSRVSVREGEGTFCQTARRFKGLARRFLRSCVSGCALARGFPRSLDEGRANTSRYEPGEMRGTSALAFSQNASS